MDIRHYYEFNDIIGSGAYGEIYQVCHKQTNVKCACKKINISDEPTSFCLYNELIARKAFDHPNIIKIHDVFYEKNEKNYICYIVMEKCEMPLFEYLLDSTSNIITGEQRMSYLEQIISGMLYMYQQGYVHNDLSLSNILIKDGQIKIIDFGFMYKRTMVQKKFHAITMYIQPPELIQKSLKNDIPSKTDSWSIGMIFYAICYQKLLIRYSSLTIYMLDLITQLKIPSFALLKKYLLLDTYKKLHTDLINQPIISDSEADRSLLVLKHLRAYHATHYGKKLQNKLIEKIPENRFIKKLLNWNVYTRPDIIGVYQLYQTIFKKSIFKKSIPMVDGFIESLNVYHTSGIQSLCINLSEELSDALNRILFIFESKPIFTIHLSAIKKSNWNYDLVVKTMNILSHCLIIYANDPSKKTSFDYVCCYRSLLTKMKPYEKLQMSYDRLYSMMSIIYHHDIYFNKIIFDEKSLEIKKFDKYEFYFLELTNGILSFHDAWDLFLEYRINKLYEPHYKFLYYIILCSPDISQINQSYVFEGIMLLILGYYDTDIRMKLINEFNNISEILDHECSKPMTPKVMNLITPEMESPTTPEAAGLHRPKHRVNINKIVTINGIIISYYILWLVQQLNPIAYRYIAKNLCGGKRFIIYLQSLFEYVHLIQKIE